MLYSAAKYQVINQPISLRMRCSVNGHGLAATSYSNKIKFPESKLAGGTLEDTCFYLFARQMVFANVSFIIKDMMLVASINFLERPV